VCPPLCLFLQSGTHDRSAFSAFGGILFGYDTGVISGIKEIQPWLGIFGSQRADGSLFLPSNHDSLVTSILSAGTFFGALLGAPVGDYIGRKWVCFVVSQIQCRQLKAHIGRGSR